MIEVTIRMNIGKVVTVLQRPKVRKYLYLLSVALVPALTAAGVLSETTAGTVLGLVGAVLSAGPGVLANRFVNVN